MPLPEETEILHLSPGTLVITIARTAYTVNNTPVEVNQMTLDAGAYILQYDFPASLFNSKSAEVSRDVRRSLLFQAERASLKMLAFSSAHDKQKKTPPDGLHAMTGRV